MLELEIAALHDGAVFYLSGMISGMVVGSLGWGRLMRERKKRIGQALGRAA
jgi:hypothetical protein